MPTYYFEHPSFLDHDPGCEHLDRPERLRAISAAVNSAPFAIQLLRRLAPRVSFEDLLRVHTAEHVDKVASAIPLSGLWNLEAETIASPGTWDAALRAAGAVCAAVDAVMEVPGSAFCAIRPPGHHAGAARVSGFCIFNNVAVAAFAAKARYGLHRVAVVDFDLHHGDGLQSLFWDEPSFLYASLHQHPYDPGTGARQERGAFGNILNIPLVAGTGSAAFREAVETELIPRLEEFRPELLLVAAGFDGHRDDPLSHLQLDTDDFGWIARQLMQIAKRHCGGRLVAALEGGYNPDALGLSVRAFLGGLIGVDGV